MSAILNPVVSVLLPVYNGAATLSGAIASIEAQTFSDWELCVVDDGSTDRSGELVQELARGDPRIRWLSRPHEGLVAALNAGLAAATGRYIARMDADDESHPERFAEQVAFLETAENRDIAVVSCGVQFGGDRASAAGYALHVDWINTLCSPEEIARNRFVESPLAHPSVMFRRELVSRHGGYRAGNFPEDYELWLRWMDAGVRFAKIPRVRLTWHDSAGRASRTDARYSPDAFFALKAPWIARELKRRDVGIEKARALWVWGAGRPTRKRARQLEQFGVSIAGYVDVDEKKQTRAIGGTGRAVIAPAALPAVADSFVLGYVSSRGARDLIRTALVATGRVEGRDFLMCA